MKKSSAMLFGLLLVLSLAFFGCNSNVGPDGDGDGGGSSEPIDSLSFNLTGAKALAAGADVSRKATDEDAFQLVKVLDDGSIEPVIELSEEMNDMWFPNVMFIAKSPISDDVFVAFQWEIRYRVEGYEDPDNGEWVDGYDQNLGSFLHITPDGTVYPVLVDDDGYPMEGRVRNNSWWGAENYKPVDFDSNGNIFFVWESERASGRVNVLYRYNPNDNSSLTLTAAFNGFEYEKFQVDPSGNYLFVKGNKMDSSSQSSFLRMYPLADIKNPVNVYYSSNQNVWVRGFKVAPDGSYIVFNGWNIRGMNGILKADINGTNLDYTPLYNSDSQDWFWPNYDEWYDEWEQKTYYNGFFDEIDPWRVRVLATDGEKFIYLNLVDLEWNSTSTTVYSYDEMSCENIVYTLGTDLWFATDSSDPTLRDMVNLTWAVFKENKNPIYKLEWWQWKSTGREVAYKDIPPKVIDFYDYDLHPENYETDADGNTYLKYDTIYMWDEHWYKDSDGDGEGDLSSGELDAELIMKYIGSYYISDIAFKWSDGSLFYGDGTDGADHAFVQALAAQPYIPEEVWNAPSSGYSISDPWHFLKEHVVEAADITVPATTFKDFRDENNLGWLDFQNIGNMFFDQQGQLWGVLAGGWWGGAGDPKPIRLLNSEGNRDLDVVDAFSGSDYKPAGFLMKSNHLYFRDAQVDIDGYEIGYHKILRYDITDPRTIMDDCLQNVPNNGFMEILDFSVDSTNSFLYFTAVSGIDLVIGKVDMVNGFAYTPFDSNLWLSNIEVY